MCFLLILAKCLMLLNNGQYLYQIKIRLKIVGRLADWVKKFIVQVDRLGIRKKPGQSVLDQHLDQN